MGKIYERVGLFLQYVLHGKEPPVGIPKPSLHYQGGGRGWKCGGKGCPMVAKQEEKEGTLTKKEKRLN